MKISIIAMALLMSFLMINGASAQIETDSYFTVEGTLWSVDNSSGPQVAFYKGSIYFCSDEDGSCLAFTVSDYRPNALFTKFSCSGLLFLPINIEGFVIPIIGKGKATVSSPDGTYDSPMTKIRDNISLE